MIYNFFKHLWYLRCIGKKKVLFCRNKSKFVSLKRILLIVSIILLTVIQSQGQEQRRDPSPEAVQRIMKLYPNPAVSFIKFDFQKDFNKGYTLQIINFLGKQVFESKNINNSTSIDLSTYSRGVYIYQLKDFSGKVAESGKFQVSK